MVDFLKFSHIFVVMDDFYYFMQSHILAKYLPGGYLPCGSVHSEVINTAMELIQSLQHNSFTRVKTLLLHGPRGTVCILYVYSCTA